MGNPKKKLRRDKRTVNESRKRRVCFIALGCPKAIVDVEKMLGLLAQAGHVICYEPEDAEVVFINTCSFINPARLEAEDTINEICELKAQNVISHVIVTGCLPQLLGKEIEKQFPDVDGFLSAAGRDDVVGFMHSIIESESPYAHFKLTAPDTRFSTHDRDRFLILPKHVSYLRIAEGCNHGCAYCLIPKIRGKYRSKKTTEILREAHELAQAGIKELILIAQDTTDFGYDLSGEHSFELLLSQLTDIPGIEWIRTMYGYPTSITEGLINTFADDNKVIPYIDLPLQHVNSDILNTMRRDYKREDIDALLDKFFTKIPELAMRTTFIVGFPGETVEQFEELMKFIEESPLMRIGVFPYFDEPGTKAYKLPGKLNQAEVDRRYEAALQVLDVKLQKIQENFIDTEFQVIIDETDDEGNFRGRSYADAPEVDCAIFGKTNDKINTGDFVNVNIDELVTFQDDDGIEHFSETFDLHAQIIDKNKYNEQKF